MLVAKAQTSTGRAGVPALRRVIVAGAATVAFMGAAGVLAGSAQAISSIFATTFGSQPQQIVIDSAGYLYTSDLGSNNVSRITPTGQTQALGLTGASPFGIAIDSSGNVYTANYVVNSVTKLAPDGSSSSPTWATTGTSPYGIVIDASGNVYVTNQNQASVTKIAPDGTANTSFASTGAGPSGIAIDSAGNLYTANQTDGTVTKIAPDGTSSGTAPGYVWATVGSGPDGIAVDSDGNVYTANSGANTVTKVAPDGNVAASWATQTNPRWVLVDSAGNLYASNTGSASISKFNTSTGDATILAPTGTSPLGMVLDAEGNLYVANAGSNNITRIGGRVAPAPPQTPSAPTAEAGVESATVTIEPNPPSAIFGTPTSYTVTAVEDPARGCTVTPPGTFCLVTGLTAGASYTFTARANLETWQTAASGPSNAVTPTAAPTPSNAFDLSRPWVRGEYLKTRISVDGPGRIIQRGWRLSVSSSARTASSGVCSVSVDATKAGARHLACRINAATQRARTRGAVRVLLRTTFTPAGGTPRTVNQRLTLRGLEPRFTG